MRQGIWIESYGLATPGKRLQWHLSHFRFKTSQCSFAGTPLSLHGSRDLLVASSPFLQPPANPLPTAQPLPATANAAGGGGVSSPRGGTGGGEGSSALAQDGVWRAGSGAIEGEIGRCVLWRFATSSIVLVLDVKESLATLSTSSSTTPTGALLLDSMFATALRFLQSLAQQCNSHRGQHVYISIIAQGSTTADLRVICHHLMLSCDNIDKILQLVSSEFDHLRTQLVNGVWCRREGQGLGWAGDEHHQRSDLQHLLINSLRLLDLLPTYGCPSITLITDGVVTMHSEMSLLDMAANLRRRDVSLQIILLETLSHTYGHVPDPDVLRKLARACNGELVRCGGDTFFFDVGMLIERVVLSRRSFLGANADWLEFWYSDYARGPSAYGGKPGKVHKLYDIPAPKTPQP
jgi:hypothetical protein